MIAIHPISPTSKALSAGKSALAARPRRHPGPAGPAQIPHRASHRPTRPARTHPLTSPRRPATPRTRSRMRVNNLQALGSRSRSMPPYRADHLFRCGCEGQKTNRCGRAERAVLLAGETAVGDPDDLGRGPVAHLVIDLADQRLSEVFPGQHQQRTGIPSLVTPCRLRSAADRRGSPRTCRGCGNPTLRILRRGLVPCEPTAVLAAGALLVRLLQ